MVCNDWRKIPSDNKRRLQTYIPQIVSIVTVVSALFFVKNKIKEFWLGDYHQSNTYPLRKVNVWNLGFEAEFFQCYFFENR